ncbi:hypothetical protein CBL_20226 [Carabus blaptoides fortunei]
MSRGYSNNYKRNYLRKVRSRLSLPDEDYGSNAQVTFYKHTTHRSALEGCPEQRTEGIRSGLSAVFRWDSDQSTLRPPFFEHYCALPSNAYINIRRDCRSSLLVWNLVPRPKPLDTSTLFIRKIH